MRIEAIARFLPKPSNLILAGAALLAARPLQWLSGTWTEAAYNAQGLWVAAIVLALFIWSLTSEQLPESPAARRYAFTLLGAAALVRAAGQLLRINVLAALTLALDVYALGVIAGVHQRRRALSPAWLAVLFTLSLPAERVLQRVLGYGLQQFSAAGACELLGWVEREVQCVGNRILLAGQDLLVDLPCSGARGLITLLTLFAALATILRPSAPRAALGLAVTLIAALAANTARIALLALGLAHPDWIGGVSVMEAPWHELLGILTLALGAVPVLLWALYVPKRKPHFFMATLAPVTPVARSGPTLGHAGALLFLLLAVGIVLLPAQPLDVSRPTPPPQLPALIAGLEGEPLALTPIEHAYFTRYGGGAARASYGPLGVLLVSTAAPLRHLHAPDECLRGSGHQVRYLGLAHTPLPTAIYRSRDVQGHVWRVAVSYVSDRGEFAASVGEVAWRWLQVPGATWTMVQRVTPWDLSPDTAQAWDVALVRALDLPARHAPQLVHLTPQP